MSAKLASARDLCLQLLAQMLWVERTLAFEVLPDLHKQVKSESLATLLADHLGETHEHVARLEVVFRALGTEAASARSAPVAGAKQEHEELRTQITDSRLADFFHAGAAVQTEHLEVAGYGLVLELLHALEQQEAAEAVGANVAEDARMLEQLNQHVERLRRELGARS